MHIAIDTRPAEAHFPGIGRYVSNLVPAIHRHLKAGERVTTLGRTALESSPPVPAVPVGASLFSLRQQWEIPARLAELSADVYHSTYFLMPYRPGIPAVLTVYDLIPFLFPDHASFNARYLFPRLLRLALSRAERVLAISECTRRDLNRYLDVPLSRVTVTPLAAESCFRPQPPGKVREVRTALGLPERYVLYVGTNRPHKNLVRLIEAWSIVRSRAPGGWKLVIAGAWDARHPEAKHRAGELHLTGDVIFAGSIPGESLPALYSGAGLFVFPSLYEGFGLPVLEAMACGVPVACSHAGSLPEVGGNAAAYFDPSDVDGMAEAIIRWLTDEAERRALGERCIVRARDFSWDETARRTLDAYRLAAGVAAEQAPSNR